METAIKLWVMTWLVMGLLCEKNSHSLVCIANLFIFLLGYNLCTFSIIKGDVFEVKWFHWILSEFTSCNKQDLLRMQWVKNVFIQKVILLNFEWIH